MTSTSLRARFASFGFFFSSFTGALVFASPARAADATLGTAPMAASVQGMPERDGASEPSPAAQSQRERYPLSVGARAFIAPPLGIAGLGAGLDVAYSVLPYLAVGGQYLTFAVDQGADPDYCERCIRTGSGALAFAEGRLWASGWATPYARLGLGLLHLNGQRVAYDRNYSEDDLALAGELGLELHYRAASLRVFAFQLAILDTQLDSDPFAGFGAQLGVRF